MTSKEQNTEQRVRQFSPEKVENELVRLDRRQWWLWSYAVIVTIVLTLAVASFSFPGLMQHAEAGLSVDMALAVRGLVGLVLIFNIYTVYQQLQINRLRRQLSLQFRALLKVENLATEVYKLAALDPLTGLYNRRSAEQKLHEEIARAERHGRALTVLLLDLDNLKQLNDTLGHVAGDHVLERFAQCLRKAIRASDYPARMGGDEFLVLLPECKPEDVTNVLRRLEGVIVSVENQQIPVSFSAGWSDYKSSDSPEELLQRADAALYESKRRAKPATLPRFPVAQSAH